MTTIALAGNPNCGKTTLFNRLTGLRQKIGNYPGVTIERRTGTFKFNNRTATMIDLPGAYSLVASSQDEAIAFETLYGRSGSEPPDAVVVLVDATNLARTLYLAVSIIELGRPTIVAVNMMDEVPPDEIDLEALAQTLKVPVVGLSAKRGDGIDALHATLEKTLEQDLSRPGRSWQLDADSEAVIKAASEACSHQKPAEDRCRCEGMAIWAIASWANQQQIAAPTADIEPPASDLRAMIDAAKGKLTTSPQTLAAKIIEARYETTHRAAQSARPQKGDPQVDATDRIDRILLHPVWGTAMFTLVMLVVFQAIFAWAEPMMDAIESLVALTQNSLRSYLPPGALRDLFEQGVVGGVGNVIVFVPQIAILFAFIAILEDSGYIARAAFLSDRLMARVGLHGRAFVPLLSGFACAVPAIMATRAIENRRDRLITILVAPLVSCSARLPVYTLLIAALFTTDQRVGGIFTVGGLMMFMMYVLSIIFTISVAFILKRTILTGPTPPLVLELPPYRRPSFSNVLRRAFGRCGLFIRDAGTVILACSIVLWALLYFPRQGELSFNAVGEAQKIQTAYRASLMTKHSAKHKEEMTKRRDKAMQRIADRIQADHLQGSFAGRIGKTIEPVIEPLGYDWKIGVGLLASFAAREVFVSTLGLIYGFGDSIDENNVSLRDRLQREVHTDSGERVYTPLVGLSLMVFFALALQCMSTVAAIRRETNSWRWPVFALAYTASLAWISAFIVYQGGRLLGFA